MGSLRAWLIKKLAGKAPVALNLGFPGQLAQRPDGTVSVVITGINGEPIFWWTAMVVPPGHMPAPPPEQQLGGRMH